MQMMGYLSLMEEKAGLEKEEAKFEQDMLVNNSELWYKLYGEEEADEGILMRPESDEDVEAMIEQFKAAGWGT